MSLVDWNEVEEGFNWVTTDHTGKIAWRVEPKWNGGMYLLPEGARSLGTWYYIEEGDYYGRSIEQRPISFADDPLALWLYNLEAKKERPFNGYDREDLIRLMHALVKELDGNQKPNPTD